MFRRLVPVGAVVALCAVGCVPVTAPLGDVDTAEPDTKLVGAWTLTDSDGVAKLLEVKTIVVDVPEVKGNAKGLMRGIKNDDKGLDLWFYPTKVGKDTYATLILGTKGGDDGLKFLKEGEFEAWKKDEVKRFFVCKYTRDGDKLTLDWGSDKFGEVMKDAKIDGTGGGQGVEFFRTPAGWLAKYLDKTGPAKIFDGTNYLKLKREKK
jgi:hypothetical protein